MFAASEGGWIVEPCVVDNDLQRDATAQAGPSDQSKPIGVVKFPKASSPYFNIPVFNYHDGLVSAIYKRQYIESARRFPASNRSARFRARALDRLDELANDPKLNLMMELEPGDTFFTPVTRCVVPWKQS